MPEYQEEWMSHEAIGRNKTLTTNKTTTENFTATKRMKRKRARGKRKERNTASKQSKPTYSRHTILPFSHNRLLFLDTTFIHTKTHTYSHLTLSSRPFTSVHSSRWLCPRVQQFLFSPRTFPDLPCIHLLHVFTVVLFCIFCSIFDSAFFWLNSPFHIYFVFFNNSTVLFTSHLEPPLLSFIFSCS